MLIPGPGRTPYFHRPGPAPSAQGEPPLARTTTAADRRHAAPPPPRWLARCYTLRAADALASSTVAYAVPLLVLHLTGSAAWTGTAFTLEWVPRLAAIAGAGPWIDRHSPQASALATGAARAATAALAAAGLLLGGGITDLLAFAVVTGVLAQCSFLASEALSADASKAAGPHAHRIQAVCAGIDQGAQLAAPLLGGLLLLIGPTAMLATITGLSLLMATQALALRTQRPRLRLVPQRPAPRLLPALTSGIRTLRQTPALAWLVAALAAGNLVSGLLEVTAPVVVTQHLHRSSAALGAMWTIAATASLLAILAARRAVERFGLYPVGLTAAITTCLAAFAAATAPDYTSFTTAIATLTAAEGAATVMLRTARARLIPAHNFGATLAATVLLVLAPIPIAGALAAAASTHLHALLLACAAGQAVALAACFSGLYRHRADYETAPETTTATVRHSEEATAA